MFYAQINSTNLCIAISQLSELMDAPDMIALDAYDETVLGKHYDAETGQFVAPAAPALPAVVITGVAVDTEHAARAQIAPDFSAMKLPVGATVTIDTELQVGGRRVPGFAAEFAMPMRSTDGVMRYLDVRFIDGRANFSAVMSDSKRWEVTHDLVNSSLPQEAHMAFAGIVITAVEGAAA